DRFQLDMRWAHACRGGAWAGYRPGARHAHWLRDDRQRSPSGAERADPLLSGAQLFPGFALDLSVVDQYADYVRDRHPAVLSADTEVFDAVATILRRRGRDARGAGAILAWGQTLSPGVRASIGDLFGCPLFEEYGAREVGPLAHECEAHAGLHVNAE